MLMLLTISLDDELFWFILAAISQPRIDCMQLFEGGNNKNMLDPVLKDEGKRGFAPCVDIDK